MDRQLPTMRVAMGSEKLRAALDAAARRGRLPGLSLNGRSEFEVADFGHPFEGLLVAQRDGDGLIRFTTRLKPAMPLVFGVVLLLTIWPGIWITDSMLRAYFSWYTVPTWWWYLPLTVPFLPLALISAVRKSRASVDAKARELIQKIAVEVDGNLVPYSQLEDSA